MMSDRAPAIVAEAALLLTGNEILGGKVRECNLYPLANALRSVGVRLTRAVAIEDEREKIAGEIQKLAADYELIFTSGGIGPTHDDVTLEAVALAYGVGTQAHPELEALLESVYGAKLTEAHSRMARVPVGSRLAKSSEIPWPIVVMDKVWLLPGVPELFRMKLSIVKEHIRGPAPLLSQAVYTLLDEGDLKPLLDQVVHAHPEIAVGSYPKWFDPTYKTKITLDGTCSTAMQQALAQLVAGLPPGEPQRIEVATPGRDVGVLPIPGLP